MLMEIAITLSAGWIVLSAFCAAAGAALWKLFPRVIRWSLEEVIEETITPELKKVNDRIDSHMNSEESSFDSIQETIENVQKQLDEKIGLAETLQATLHKTNDILEKHMAEDKDQFAAAQNALVLGQQDLIKQLSEIKNANQNNFDEAAEDRKQKKKKK